MTAAVVDLESDFWLAVAEGCELGDVCSLLKAIATDENSIGLETVSGENAVVVSKQFPDGDNLA